LWLFEVEVGPFYKILPCHVSHPIQSAVCFLLSTYLQGL
jgi:hypothetical protein